MRLPLAYGHDGFELDLPEAEFAPTVILPRAAQAHPDPEAAFLAAVRQPHNAPSLAELVRNRRPRRHRHRRPHPAGTRPAAHPLAHHGDGDP